MFGSERVQSIVVTIEADPGGAEIYYVWRAPRPITVLAAYRVDENTQNAGTATKLTLHNYGTAGTAIKSSNGTIVATLGGTASAARLTAHVPATGVVDASGDNIAQGEWLVLDYAEEGTGWISGDRLTYQIDYVIGLGA